jgi:hypothetical protein
MSPKDGTPVAPTKSNRWLANDLRSPRSESPKQNAKNLERPSDLSLSAGDALDKTQSHSAAAELQPNWSHASTRGRLRLVRHAGIRYDPRPVVRQAFQPDTFSQNKSGWSA